MDEFGDHVSHELSAGLCADRADPGWVDIDDAGAVMLPSVPSFGIAFMTRPE